MFPAKIDEYVRPESVSEALAAMARYDEGEAIFLAGGQSVMQAVKSRIVQPQCVIDLQSVADLKGVSRSGDAVTIGAMTRYVDIANDESLTGSLAALRDGAARVGDRQVRNRGTIGGSVCWNYVASCLPTVVLGLDGAMNLMNAAGDTRTVSADDFFLGPLETAREEQEILLSIAWDSVPANSGSAYKKWGLVTDALPVVGVCVLVTVDGGKCSAARMSISGLSDGGQRCTAGEESLIGCDGSAESIAAAMNAAAEATDTHSDSAADADYRKQLIRTLGAEVTARAFDRANA